MMTVSEPAGSTAIFYNKDGITVSHIAGGVSGAVADAVAIVRYSQTTVVVVSSPNSGHNPAISLPTDADIGDVVEVYGVVQSPAGRILPQVYPIGSETIATSADSTDGFGGAFAAMIFRKVSSTNWAVIVTGSGGGG